MPSGPPFPYIPILWNSLMNKPDRNKHYKSVYRIDRLARWVITAGGYGIVLSIALILLFLVYQSFPLAADASVEELFSKAVGSDDNTPVLLTGVDSYQEVGYVVARSGAIEFYRIGGEGETIDRARLALGENEKLVGIARAGIDNDIFAAATDSGRVIFSKFEMNPKYTAEGRTIIPSYQQLDTWPLSLSGDSLRDQADLLVFRQNESLVQFLAWTSGNTLKLKIYDSEYEERYEFDLTPHLQDRRVSALTLSYDGEALMAATGTGHILWFNLIDFEDVELRDEWQAANQPISRLAFLLGNQNLIVGAADGGVESWFAARNQNGRMEYQQIHTYEKHESKILEIAISPRNRTFLTLDAAGSARLHYATSGKTTLHIENIDHPVRLAEFTPKSDGIVLVDDKQQFCLYKLDDPHPETSANSLFGRVWYEGYEDPEFVWQSTGGSNEFESKFSLIPLIFGTLKGTLYAMLFSIPLAILAAIYVSQFAPVWMARIVKPTVEIMAALPSVVIGFLAGLYFSTLFEKHLVTFLSLPLFLTMTFMLGILIWRMIPESLRSKLPPGGELLFAIPVLLLSGGVSYLLSDSLELLLFGGNIQQWFFLTFDMTYETRNSLVVGFALGFAVIPIIFTMTEDALTNVPESLRSASLALGASKWQTVLKIIIPAASGGIFAAIMLGLGRAVGETMIVLMATGNTPILDLSPFNGFRAMSATIAVEIPEAPVGGSLYRVLFLTALLLFVFTFVLNSLSSVVGERLRRKYARF